MIDDKPDEAIAYLNVFVKFGKKFIVSIIYENDKDYLTFLYYMASFTKLAKDLSRNNQNVKIS